MVASPKPTGKETAAAKWTSRVRIVSPPSSARPLVPVTEKKIQNDANSVARPRKQDADGDRWDITPDGGSAGREGRQFTVANVGNNGRIYLR